jgi:hypothetical protein
MRSPTPVRFRASDCRRIALLHGQRGEEVTDAAVGDTVSLRIRRPGPRRSNKRKAVTQ